MLFVTQSCIPCTIAFLYAIIDLDIKSKNVKKSYSGIYKEIANL